MQQLADPVLNHSIYLARITEVEVTSAIIDGWGPYHEQSLALAAGVDVLVHDAQYTAEEFPARAHFGHSAVGYPVELGRRAGAGRVLLFHHDPSRTDAEIDAIVAGLAAAPLPVIAAAEEMVIDLLSPVVTPSG